MLLGERGCGKHTFVSEISKTLTIPLVDITDDISLETINKAMLEPMPVIYMIDSSSITVKEENTILKFLEEPMKNTYIVILCENKNGLIETVVNRCIIWEFEKYNSSFCREFVKDSKLEEMILRVATTPGQVIELESNNIQEMFDLANKMFDRIAFASIPNALSISDKFSFKNEKNKFNIDMFVKILICKITDLVRSVTDYKLYNAYILTDELSNNINARLVNKRYLFEDYLIRLRDVLRGDHS